MFLYNLVAKVQRNIDFLDAFCVFFLNIANYEPIICHYRMRQDCPAPC